MYLYKIFSVRKIIIGSILFIVHNRIFKGMACQNWLFVFCPLKAVYRKRSITTTWTRQFPKRCLAIDAQLECHRLHLAERDICWVSLSYLFFFSTLNNHFSSTRPYIRFHCLKSRPFTILAISIPNFRYLNVALIT